MKHSTTEDVVEMRITFKHLKNALVNVHETTICDKIHNLRRKGFGIKIKKTYFIDLYGYSFYHKLRERHVPLSPRGVKMLKQMFTFLSSVALKQYFIGHSGLIGVLCQRQNGWRLVNAVSAGAPKMTS